MKINKNSDLNDENFQIYDTCLINGTFDIIHIGHKKYIKHAFNSAKMVYIHLASDKLAKSLKKNYVVKPYSIRKQHLKSYIDSIKNGHTYSIKCANTLKDFKNFCINENKLDIVLAAEQKYVKLFKKCNELRNKKNKNVYAIKKIELVTDKNGKKVSSTVINGDGKNQFYPQI
jgi:cytidyltransferase-like protein